MKKKAMLSKGVQNKKLPKGHDKPAQKSDEELYREVFGDDAEKMLKLTPQRKTEEEMEAEFEKSLARVFDAVYGPARREEDMSYWDKMRARALEYDSTIYNGLGMVHPKIMNNHFRRLNAVAKRGGVSFIEALIGDMESVAKYELLRRNISPGSGRQAVTETIDSLHDDISKIQIDSAYHAVKSARRLRKFLKSNLLSKEYVKAIIDMMKLAVFSVQSEMTREACHGITASLGRHNAGKRPKQLEPLKNAVEQIIRERLASGKSAKAREIWDQFKKHTSNNPYRIGAEVADEFGDEYFAYMDSDETTIIVYKEDKKETKEVGKRKFDAIQKYRTEIVKKLRKEGITT